MEDESNINNSRNYKKQNEQLPPAHVALAHADKYWIVGLLKSIGGYIAV